MMDMPFDPIQGQGQGHGASEVPKLVLFKVYRLHHSQRELANDHSTNSSISAQYLNLFGPDF